MCYFDRLRIQQSYHSYGLRSYESIVLVAVALKDVAKLLSFPSGSSIVSAFTPKRITWLVPDERISLLPLSIFSTASYLQNSALWTSAPLFDAKYFKYWWMKCRLLCTYQKNLQSLLLHGRVFEHAPHVFPDVQIVVCVLCQRWVYSQHAWRCCTSPCHIFFALVFIFFDWENNRK